MRPAMSMARLGLTHALLVTLAACSTSRANTRALRGDECHFTVVNRTGGPLAIRHFKQRSAVEIGAINPNEQVSATTACGDGQAFVAGIPIPLQAGAPLASPPVFGSVELVPGERTRMSLFWP